MKYLTLLILSICLISLASADIYFSDNPNEFLINSYQAPTGNQGLGSPGGASAADLINVTNATNSNLNISTNLTQPQNVTTTIIQYIPGGSNFIWVIIIILIIIFYNMKEKKEEVRQVSYY